MSSLFSESSKHKTHGGERERFGDAIRDRFILKWSKGNIGQLGWTTWLIKWNIVLDISLNPFKDEGKQQSKVEFDECYEYNFMGDSSKQLNISLVSVQKYPLRNSFWLYDALLL